MIRCFQLTAAVLGAALLSGCATPGGGGGAATTTPAAQATKVGPGMNADGEVVDASKVEAGYGQSVTGLGDWQGEITGKPFSGSTFSRLQIGMPLRQVEDTVGPPTDQGAYITGKAFIPFYFGSDRYRYEMVYRGQGRLIFAGGSTGDLSGAHLIWIIYCATEAGYR